MLRRSVARRKLWVWSLSRRGDAGTVELGRRTMQGGSEAVGRYRRLELGSALLLQQRAATRAEEAKVA